MSESRHSPEPWVVYDAKYPGIDAGSGEAVVFYSDEQDSNDGGIRGGFDETTDPQANARRIVACVNACAGIPTEALESGALGKALEALKSCVDFDGRYWPDVFRDATDALRALGRLP